MDKIKYSLFLIFSLSGFSGLLYESIWSHYVKLILGHAAYSQTLVLIIFMGGMALGSWWVSKFSSTLKNPLLGYAIIEGLIGLLGLLFHREFSFFHDLLFDVVLQNIDSAVLNLASKWLFAGILLLPQAILLGMTFPLMSSAIIRLDIKSSGHTLGVLYFSNSLGAAIGVLCSGFFLIEWIGLPGTVLTAACINILIAFIVWLLASSALMVSSTLAIQKNEMKQTTFYFLLSIALITGMTSFFYEIGWIRMLSLVLSSSVQAFELMLSAFISGIAFGSYYIRKKIDGLTAPEVYLAWVQIIMGLLAVLTLPLYIESFSVMSFLFKGLAKTGEGYSLFNFSSQLIALILMMPTTFMAGMTLPLLSNTLFKSGGNESAIGQIYAANTLGAIIGVILAVHFIMPLLGLKQLILAGSFIDILLGLAILSYYSKNWFKIRSTVTSVSIILLVVGVCSFTEFDKKILASGVYRFGSGKLGETINMLFYKDGKTASIALLKNPDNSLVISTNGKADAKIAAENASASSDESTMVTLAMLPLTLNPQAKKVANIGFGSGLTSHVLLAADSIEQLDTIEIEAAMVEGARGFGTRVERVFKDPRSKIYIDDAKSFFSSKKTKYDIIVSEPSNPWMNGVASLFSYEFYNTIQPHLNKDGIFVQWLQLYEINIDNVSSVVKALSKSFPYFRIYNTDTTDILIVASKENKLDKMDDFVFKNIKTRAELKRVGIEHIDDFNIRYLGDKKLLTPLFFLMDTPMNSDYFPYLGYKAPKARYLNQNTADLSWIHIANVPVLQWLNGKMSQDNTSSEGQFLEFYDYKKLALAIINHTSIENQKIEFANATIQQCQNANVSVATKIMAYETIAGVINPYLSSTQIDTFWKNALKDCAVNNEENNLTLWLYFHAAIGQRDEKSTLQYGEKLIANYKTFSHSQQDYLITALLTASIASNQNDKALAYIKQFQLMKTLAQQSLATRLLVALALENISNSAQQK